VFYCFFVKSPELPDVPFEAPGLATLPALPTFPELPAELVLPALPTLPEDEPFFAAFFSEVFDLEFFFINLF